MKAFILPLLITALTYPCLGQAQDPFEPSPEQQTEEESDRAAFFGGNGPVNLTSLRGKPIKNLDLLACDDLKDISPVAGLKLKDVMLWKIDIEDISPLAGMPIQKLVIFGCPVKDLTVLKGMPLKSLWIGATKVTDFSPLKNLPLTDLSLHSSEVSNLSPLEGMPLESLNIRVTGKISDLTPLKGMKLKTLDFDSDTVTRGMDIIRDMKSLKEINRMPADEFWRNYDAQQIERKNKAEQGSGGQPATRPESK
ncbi:MAG: hypothetical protein NTV46_11375 [Verrucomicrobia bacterium]|nr:hypothetical protein [Verrucomicrobiota bacterium]